ncbi:DUF6079 family protein [Dehalobacter sp.]|uniref:DUF6079 family protein n=1 Tax=Dehalobacter sp. TaxID=1962289 RepID=UPI0025834543|nr:DUF6079 family protein [Dehalobacter sp.]MDJ0306792.1 DUF6079 family protein [Dehalobacter sp.]
MKYADLINFNPIESIIQLTAANDKKEAVNLVKSYVMSDDMADKLKNNMLSQLRLEDVVDNKGVLLVGNYGTGKSHLMSVISSVAFDAENLNYIQNQKFADEAKSIAGKFEVLRIEIGASKMSLRNIILTKVKQDFAERGLSFEFPDEKDIISNKDVLINIMEVFSSKYADKGYLIVVDEFLDYLGGRKSQEVKLDLGFMRELGEIIKSSRLRAIFGVQEKLFDNPNFSFVSTTLNRVKDRFEQVIIRKEDTAFVVSERILKKTPEQKALIREHLQLFCSLYTNMSERIEEYVDLFPIHPSYIEVFNKIYIIENRHILKNISEIIRRILNDEITAEAPGIVSFDSYWAFIRENLALKTDANIKEVVEKSGMLEDIVNRSFPKRLYKPLALQIINALSVHRLTTGDISLRAGLTAENLRDDLCLYLKGMPDQSSDTLQSVVQTVLKDVMTTVSGQFIEHNGDNGQYYLDLKKDIDYDEKITQRAAVMDDDSLNNYFYDVLYYCLDWEQKEHVTNFKIYEHTLNWASHNIFRRGYLFLGTPESRPTAQPPEDYYIYFIPPYGNEVYSDEKKNDEVFFIFKPSEDFKNTLKLYAAALMMRDLAEEKNKAAYQSKAEVFKKKLMKYLSENKNTCFEVIYKGEKKQLLEVMKGQYKNTNPFKETMDLVASICLDGYFTERYPEMPYFKVNITERNQAETIRAGIDRFAGRKNQQANALLESFGLLEGEKISVQNSKYAQYFIKELDKLPAKSVINFNDIYEETFIGYNDKRFGISYVLLPIVLLALVHTGNIVIALKSGTTLTASDLETLPKINATDIYEFKYISKPKDVQLVELVRLYELLELPVGLINNPAQREAGLEQMLAKAQEMANVAVRANSKLNEGFELWGEQLIADHIASGYKTSAKGVLDIFGNFQSRFNTVAKLNNFNYTSEQIEQLGKDMAAAKTVLEYEKFKNDCLTNVNYMMNLERMELSPALKNEIEAAKDNFRKIRDDIPEDMNGEAAATDVNSLLTKVKNQYIDVYFDEHQKKRLGIAEGKRKGELISSIKLANLKRLKAIDILSASKLDSIEKDLAGLKVCFELTAELIKTTHFCTKCNFLMGESDIQVKGRLDELEDRIDGLLAEWTNTLFNTVTDPTLEEQKQYLSAEQQKVISTFIKSKALPEKIDQFFINAIEALLQGFEPVSIAADDLIDKLDALGPCDMETFQHKLNELLNSYTKGKDRDKLRIVVKR